MSDKQPISDELLAEQEEYLQAIKRGVRNAMIYHKNMGLPVVGTENGQIVWVPAEEIVIPELP
ncbi:MAG: hypothetical protein HQL52_03645 [Magnetococcales bacterium]|nr:hypothetical protein [Magnetococcales bacterium]